jgi:hypothetical protein
VTGKKEVNMKRTLWVLLALLVASPAWAQLRPGAFTTLTTTDTGPDSLHVGCAVNSSTCTGGIKAGSIQVSSISASGTITISGSAQINGSFAVTGPATFANLTATGTASLNALAVTGTGASTFAGPITVTGNFPGATAGFFWNQSASGAGFATSGGVGSQYALSVRNNANNEVARINADGTMSMTGGLTTAGVNTPGSISAAGNVSGGTISGVSSQAGAYVGVFQNGAPGGHGVLIEAASSAAQFALRVDNYAGTPIWYVLGDGSMTTGADATIGRNLRVNGGVSMASGGTDGNFSVGGVFSVSNKFAVSNTTGNVNMYGGALILDAGGIDVGGNSVFRGNTLTVLGALGVGGDLNSSNSIHATLDLTAGRNFAVTQNANVGSLTVGTGGATFNGPVTVNHNFSTPYNITTGTLNVTGAATLASATLSGNINVAGNTTTGTLNTTGAATLQSLSVATATAINGDLTVNGTVTSPNNTRFAGRNGGGTLVAPNTTVLLLWDTHEVNTNVYSSGGLYVPTAGYYLFGVSGLRVDTGGNTTTLVEIIVYKNGAPITPGCGQGAFVPSTTILNTSCGAQLAAGDSISVVAHHDSAVSIGFRNDLGRFWLVKLW